MALVLCSMVPGWAQAVVTAGDLDRAMASVGRNVTLAGTAIEAKDYNVAKERVARAREQLSPTFAFWEHAKKTDAQRLVRDAAARLDDLDLALSREPVEATGIAQAKRAVDASCQACHSLYREQDPATNRFRLKAQPMGPSEK